MSQWAILSGIEGNLAAYDAVMNDIKRQVRELEAVYILGDLVGPRPECEELVKRVRSPKNNEIEPQICTGWWEEQCFILHGIGTQGEPTELKSRYGGDTVVKLWNSVTKKTVEWLRYFDFGFFELDCLLIHGSTVSVDDALTPETPPIIMLDRLLRDGANNLFCGRYGQTFEYCIETGSLSTSVTTLDAQNSPQTIKTTPRRVVGVGNVGRTPGEATYTLYNPTTNRVEFRSIRYHFNKGFQP
ncbi:metallophosphatase [Microseira sp. BLCC-F43]|jgi:hypothetical protein|uniref:metallophosphatase n=1 Tax=Microseira sp. BLCC-F43 TaxID=3153602 RepID=UPI0035BAE54A